MTSNSVRNMKFAIGTTIAIAALMTASGALTRFSPKQVDSTNPSVTYQYSDDKQLIEANQQASTYCNQFDSSAQTQSFSSDENGSSIVAFECVSKSLDATSANPPNSDLRYSYLTDQELPEASSNAQVYCVNHGSPEMDSTVVENSKGSKTVTFRCNAN